MLGFVWCNLVPQRLDDQYLMRPSEAPMLKRLPSEYMREHCWHTTQPMETSNMKAPRQQDPRRFVAVDVPKLW